ncbi:TPA: hypothetical protein HA251_02930 [Candidatus Woesearchaeota archaeon]|nr:hypothetical protein [Candidatus Woesearchaeota archaeon]
MIDTRVYAFMLDLFPLTDGLSQECSVLGDRLQSAGIELVMATSAGFPVHNLVSRLELLLRLARDLGHIEEDVHEFLSRSLKAIADEAHRSGEL